MWSWNNWSSRRRKTKKQNLITFRPKSQYWLKHAGMIGTHQCTVFKFGTKYFACSNQNETKLTILWETHHLNRYDQVSRVCTFRQLTHYSNRTDFGLGASGWTIMAGPNEGWTGYCRAAIHLKGWDQKLKS